uniref:Uncharacterized protein n=1 Tax=Candidatus Kentrum sp. LFY TaxID=2126342 RepID=A0A450UHI3_9GAMM|nr:MAG: hypothetical protein BECKLFY1418B_GA0070995_103021 [Candidatus Kentron sp. LFY]VFJ95273.1 MAG: hypothetical protein BECKLFY1418A_GA0070994_104823 [Candidatus Kentron sp. LFY]
MSQVLRILFGIERVIGIESGNPIGIVTSLFDFDSDSGTKEE